MIKKRFIKYVLIIGLIFFTTNIYSQHDIKPDKKSKALTWSLIQLIPSPFFASDANENNARIQLSFQWQFIPLNFSFNANKYVSPIQFFMISPVRRFTGSAEIFVQPEIATTSFNYSGFKSFAVNVGSRLIIPVQEMGENISFSIGGKYSFRKNDITGEKGYPGVEAGVYFLGGQIGLQFVKNFNKNNLYSFGFYFKYY